VIAIRAGVKPLRPCSRSRPVRLHRRLPLGDKDKSRDLAISTIRQDPQIYFRAQRKTLGDRLNDLRLDPAREQEIIDKRSVKTIRDELLGLFPIGKLVATVLNWNADVDSDLQDAKRDILLSQTLDKLETTGHAVEQLKAFVSDPYGSTLFNKILRTLDDSPPNPELTRHLSQALAVIVDSDFQSLFSEHRYALSQIDQLSPQALSIIADQSRWPKVQLTSMQSMGNTVMSDWSHDFAQSYAGVKRLTDDPAVSRLRHAATELRNRGLVEMRANGECELTRVGTEVHKYVAEV
jgi:hypothetical protein